MNGILIAPDHLAANALWYVMQPALRYGRSCLWNRSAHLALTCPAAARPDLVLIYESEWSSCSDVCRDPSVTPRWCYSFSVCHVRHLSYYLHCGLIDVGFLQGARLIASVISTHRPWAISATRGTLPGRWRRLRTQSCRRVLGRTAEQRVFLRVISLLPDSLRPRRDYSVGIREWSQMSPPTWMLRIQTRDASHFAPSWMHAWRRRNIRLGFASLQISGHLHPSEEQRLRKDLDPAHLYIY